MEDDDDFFTQLDRLRCSPLNSQLLPLMESCVTDEHSIDERSIDERSEQLTPVMPVEPGLFFDPPWDDILAMRFADYIWFATKQYSVRLGLYVVVYGPSLPTIGLPSTRDYKVLIQCAIGPQTEDIVRLCLVRCLKRMGVRREIMLSIRFGVFSAPGTSLPRSNGLDIGRLWEEDTWDATLLGEELCYGDSAERVWGHPSWGMVCGMNGIVRGIDYQLIRV
ncbi:hypothetical protein F5Y10DRAFT_263776 [Nemania abortiva]|nr:hypothetical protein F5Y10DRAFT_263776 [Nemania abortiva]